MKIGVDLDSVIFKPLVPFYHWFERVLPDFWLRFGARIIGAKAWSWTVNEKFIKVLNYISMSGGHEVIIVSGRPLEQEEAIIDCLNKSGVRFDRLWLCPDHESIDEFKLVVIRKEGCEIFIETNTKVAGFLLENHPALEVLYYV